MASTPREKKDLRSPSKRERTRARLLDAGVRVFGARGVGLTVDEVVAAAGVSHGTFYNYFNDSDALIEAVALHALLSLGDALARTGHPDPAVRFAETTLELLGHIQARPELARAILRLANRLDVDEVITARMRADLAAGREAGCFTARADDLAEDIVLGVLLVCVRRIASARWSPDRATAVTRRLLENLGVDSDTARDLVSRAGAPSPQTAEPPQP